MKFFSKVVAIYSLAVLMAVPVHAQDRSTFDLSAGYDFLRIAESPQNASSGWYAEISSNITPRVSPVGRVTAHYQNIGPGALHTIAAGMRFTFQHKSTAPFADALFGAAILSSNSVVTFPPNHTGPVPLGLRGSGGSALLQAGAGLDLFRDATMGVRIGGDFVRGNRTFGNMFRLSVGLVLHLDRQD